MPTIVTNVTKIWLSRAKLTAKPYLNITVSLIDAANPVAAFRGSCKKREADETSN